MSYIRLLVSAIPAPGEALPLMSAQAHHLFRVRRREEGDLVMIQTPGGRRALAELRGSGPGDAWVVCREYLEDIKGVLPVDLYPALLPDSAFAFLLQKSTEVGVRSVTPVITEFTVAKAGDREKKMARWQKICDEAACQCGGIPAIVREPLPFNEALAAEADLRILADGSGKVLKELETEAKSAALMIGPEGGHSLREMKLAEEAGWLKVAFHPFILRAETAAPVCAALLQQRFGEL